MSRLALPVDSGLVPAVASPCRNGSCDKAAPGTCGGNLLLLVCWQTSIFANVVPDGIDLWSAVEPGVWTVEVWRRALLSGLWLNCVRLYLYEYWSIAGHGLPGRCKCYAGMIILPRLQAD
jgi:hypothetical protein